MIPLLDVDRLSVGYGDLLILREVSIEVREGEFVALVGPNGSGKTTLMRALTGLLPPRGGTVRFRGDRIDGLPPYAIAALGITCIPEGRQLFRELTVRENLELGAYLPRARPREGETLRLIFRLFPFLENRSESRAEGLSGGEQQMLALARGLMARPRLLLLDDPFLGLARVVMNRFCEALREITHEGLAILAAGQHVRHLLHLAHRGYFLDEGRIVRSGSGAELLADGHLRRALLEFGPEEPGQMPFPDSLPAP